MKSITAFEEILPLTSNQIARFSYKAFTKIGRHGLETKDIRLILFFNYKSLAFKETEEQ